MHVGSSGWLRLFGTNSKFVLYSFLLLMKNVLRHDRKKKVFLSSHPPDLTIRLIWLVINHSREQRSGGDHGNFSVLFFSRSVLQRGRFSSFRCLNMLVGTLVATRRVRSICMRLVQREAAYLNSCCSCRNCRKARRARAPRTSEAACLSGFRSLGLPLLPN